jgi:transposase
MRKPYPTDLSDAEWNHIEPHLPAPNGYGRPRTHSLREILDAVFYVLKSGCQWRLLPHDFLQLQLDRLEPDLSRGRDPKVCRHYAATLMPEAFEHGRLLNSMATAAGFLVSFILSG